MDTHADHLGKMQGDRPHLGMWLIQRWISY
jgi:hypothetical protein